MHNHQLKFKYRITSFSGDEVAEFEAIHHAQAMEDFIQGDWDILTLVPCSETGCWTHKVEDDAGGVVLFDFKTHEKAVPMGLHSPKPDTLKKLAEAASGAAKQKNEIKLVSGCTAGGIHTKPSSLALRLEYETQNIVKVIFEPFNREFFAHLRSIEPYFFDRVAVHASYSAGLATSLAVIAQRYGPAAEAHRYLLAQFRMELRSISRLLSCSKYMDID